MYLCIDGRNSHHSHILHGDLAFSWQIHLKKRFTPLNTLLVFIGQCQSAIPKHVSVCICVCVEGGIITMDEPVTDF